MTKVIVEGCDGSGKTTLLRQLMQEFPGELKPRVVDKDTNAMVDLKRWVEDDVAEGEAFVGEDEKPELVFYDRHRLISEPIYGPILRREQQPGFDSFVWVQSMLRQFRQQAPIIIYCIPPASAVHQNLMDDEANVAVFNHWQSIYSAYLTRAALDKLGYAGYRVFIYDYTKTFNENAIIHIRSALYKEFETQ